MFITNRIPSLYYTVNSAQNALIIQDGKIIEEPKGPGLHFKIPYLQKVHKIDVERISRFSLPLPDSESLQAIIMWQVKDPKKYYMASREKNFHLKLEAIVKPTFDKILKDFDLDTIIQIQKKQQKDPDFSNSQHSKILIGLQKAVEEYGIFIYNIFIKNN